MELGQFAGDDDSLGGTEGDFDVRECIEDAVRGFVEDLGNVVAGKSFESGFSLALLGGKKAVEGEGLGVEAAGDECADGGVGSGDGEDGDAGGDGCRGNLVAWVGDPGGSGVRDYGDASAGF